MINRIKKYIRDIQLEWQKVSKPDWKSVQGNTLVVIVACLILGVFLWLVDGTADFPDWFSPFGLILLVVVIPLCVYFITRNNTPQWKIATLVSFSPLA
ncbi:MAG: preprotein translocase subunit SecE, partial [Candidatus Poribacteria bacterium]